MRVILYDGDVFACASFTAFEEFSAVLNSANFLKIVRLDTLSRLKLLRP